MSLGCVSHTDHAALQGAAASDQADEPAGDGGEKADYSAVFAHYINETLLFETSLRELLGAAAEEDETAEAGEDDDDGEAENRVGRSVVGLCLTCVLARGAPGGGPGRRWLELEHSQAMSALAAVSTDALAAADGEGALAVVALLLDTLAQVTERLQLLPVGAAAAADGQETATTPLARAFVEHVHVPLLADYHGRVCELARHWSRGRASRDAREGHYLLGCAIHNSAAIAAATLSEWGDELFFLSLQPAADEAFFGVDRPGSVGEWRQLQKRMVSALADAIVHEVGGPLRQYCGAAESQGVFWLPPVEQHAPSISVGCRPRQHSCQVAVSGTSALGLFCFWLQEEVRPLLSDLGALLRLCATALAPKGWSVPAPAHRCVCRLQPALETRGG